jgi:plastocyanin
MSDDDDGGKIFKAFFDYEDGEITAAEFMDIFVESFTDDGDPALYDTYTFTITTEDEGLYSLHPKFGSHSEGSHDFICGNGDTISFKFVNDGYGDCPDGADEQWYDSGTSGDTSDDCQMWNDATCSGDYVNWFDCHDGSEIWIVEVNNGDDNCSYGEDEAYDEDSSSHWYGHVFLYTGNFTVPDSTENLIGTTTHFCGYEDENKTEVHCEDVWEEYLVAGDYTIVTAGQCYEEWTDEDGDGEYESEGELKCEHGNYTHVVTNDTGDVVEEFHGTVEHDLTHMMWLTMDHWTLMEESRSSFPLYETHAFTVGTDGFNGAIVSAQYQCYDVDGDGDDDDCHGANLALYLYEGGFDPEDTYAGLLSSDDWTDDFGLDCPAGEYDDGGSRCGYSRLEELELSAGDYVVVTAGSDTWSEGSYKNDIVAADGIIIESWDGKLKGYYWDCCDDDGNMTLVEGDERAQMPPPWEYDGRDDDYLYMSLLENVTGYQDGTLSADESAGNVLSILYEADEAGLFNDGGDDYDDGDGSDSDDCPFDSMDFCYEIGPYCDDGSDMYDPWYCGSESAHYCLEDGADDQGCIDIDEIAADCDAGEENQEICDAFLNFDHDAYHGETDDDPVTLDGVEGVEEPDDWDDRMIPSSENMVGDLADNEGTPMMMHSSFTITFDSVDDSLASHVFVIPGNSDDDDWEDGDEDPPWKFDFTVAEGYKIDSCTGCDDAEYSDDGRTLSFLFDDDSTDDVVITFSNAPSVDCDHVVGLDSTGFAFDPMDLAIDVGDTVCWQWTDAADAHNVLELKTNYESGMNITEVTVTGGFTSGEPSNTVDFRQTFNTDDQTHYYVCVPHAESMSMVGRIVVGNGTEDDPIQEAIEESGLPSIGFVVGVLVLVGAAGLRRRIH